MTLLPPEELQEIERVCEAATRGPWREGLGSGVCLMSAVFGPAGTEDERLIADNAPDWAVKEGKAVHVTEANANLIFIAAARSDIPNLLSHIKTQQEELERLKKNVKAGVKWIKKERETVQEYKETLLDCLPNGCDECEAESCDGPEDQVKMILATREVE